MRATESNTLLVDPPAGEPASVPCSSSGAGPASGLPRSSRPQGASGSALRTRGPVAGAYQRILVCIKDPQRDQDLLEHAAAVSRLAETREVHVLHVHPGKAVGSTWTANGISIVGRSISSSVLRKLATEHFQGHGQEKIQCPVVHGSPMIGILRYAYDREIDLIVMGRRGESEKTEHDASLARHLVRKSTCSVLVVPLGSAPKWGRILVPVRDSECSANALETACQLGAAAGAEVLALNVYQVRSGYLSVGKSLDEQVGILGQWADRICRELLDRLNARGAEARSKCLPDLYHKPAKIMLEEVAGGSADMVVIGARRRSGAAGILLSRVAEELIRRSTVPVLAVKKKGENIGLLKALLTLAG
jgi:nucleotide-binding universal stress UspA family protein